MEMVEQVAIAIHQALAVPGEGWDQLPAARRDRLRDAARRAIQALRSPSDAMLAEGGRRDLPQDAANIWERMIFRALQG